MTQTQILDLLTSTSDNLAVDTETFFNLSRSTTGGNREYWTGKAEATLTALGIMRNIIDTITETPRA